MFKINDKIMNFEYAPSMGAIDRKQCVNKQKLNLYNTNLNNNKKILLKIYNLKMALKSTFKKPIKL